MSVFSEASPFEHLDNLAISLEKVDRVVNFEYNFKNCENKNENENKEVDIVFHYSFGDSTRTNIFESVRTIKSKRSLAFELRELEKNVKLFTSSIDANEN